MFFVKKKSLTFFSLLIVCFCTIQSCTKKESVEPDYKPKIVVDGWIENDAYATVFVSQTTQYESVIDTASYYKTILTHAKVVLKTDSAREVLTLARNMDFFPPHFYKSTKIKGKVGKTYWLEVIYNGDTVRSQTYIPSPPSLKKIYFECDKTDPELGYIWVGFNDPASEVNYYRMFTKIKGVDTRYVATYLSSITDLRINGQYTEFPLYRGLTTNTNRRQDYRYAYGETVFLKFCSLPVDCYRFWVGYENEILNSSNPFMNGGSNPPSNIEGGLGVWCGYGARYYSIITTTHSLQEFE